VLHCTISNRMAVRGRDITRYHATPLSVSSCCCLFLWQVRDLIEPGTDSYPAPYSIPSRIPFHVPFHTQPTSPLPLALSTLYLPSFSQSLPRPPVLDWASPYSAW
jgi:hypothetical protein